MKMRQTIKLARFLDKKARAEKTGEKDQNRFEGLEHHLRRELVADPGELDFRRFLLSSDPKLREKIKTLRNTVEGLRTKYPEIIGMTLFGSHTKGYPDSQSDIDGYIYLD